MSGDETTFDPERPTQVTCPACESVGGELTLSCDCCEGTGVVTVDRRADWLRAFPQKRPVQCPRCDGKGMVSRQVSETAYAGRVCPVCNGATVVPLERARDWKIAHSNGVCRDDESK